MKETINLEQLCKLNGIYLRNHIGYIQSFIKDGMISEAVAEIIVKCKGMCSDRQDLLTEVNSWFEKANNKRSTFQLKNSFEQTAEQISFFDRQLDEIALDLIRQHFQDIRVKMGLQ